MTYAYDDYIQMPTKDLYDTAVMKMAIEAAKDMYDKGLALMENFYKTYGDFMSPFARDMETYGAAMDKVRETVNDAYARGIDLARSPEGRAIIAQLTHSIDPRWYNTARQNAKVGYAYLEAIKEAARKGEYNKEFEDWLLLNGGPGLFENFSSEGGKIWDRTAPGRFQDVSQWTGHLFENIERSYDPTTSQLYPGFMAYTKDKAAMDRIAANNMPFLSSSDLGRYMISKLTNQYKSQGLSDVDALSKAVDSLQKLVVNSNWDQSLKLETNPYYLDRKRTENDDWADERKRKRDYQYDLLGRYDLDLNGTLDANERKIAEKYLTKTAKSNGKDTDHPNVFREAEAYADSAYEGIINDKSRWRTFTKNGKTYVKKDSLAIGTHVGYVKEDQYNLNIDFIIPSQLIQLSNADDKTDKPTAYKFNSLDANNHLYAFDENTGKMTKIRIDTENSTMTFKPHGNLRAVRTSKGYRYFVNGDINGKTVWIEVKERAFNHGLTKK